MIETELDLIAFIALCGGSTYEDFALQYGATRELIREAQRKRLVTVHDSRFGKQLFLGSAVSNGLLLKILNNEEYWKKRLLGVCEEQKKPRRQRKPRQGTLDAFFTSR